MIVSWSVAFLTPEIVCGPRRWRFVQNQSMFSRPTLRSFRSNSRWGENCFGFNSKNFPSKLTSWKTTLLIFDRSRMSFFRLVATGSKSLVSTRPAETSSLAIPSEVSAKKIPIFKHYLKNNSLYLCRRWIRIEYHSIHALCFEFATPNLWEHHHRIVVADSAEAELTVPYWVAILVSCLAPTPTLLAVVDRLSRWNSER